MGDEAGGPDGLVTGRCSVNATVVVELCGGPLDGRTLEVDAGMPTLELFADPYARPFFSALSPDAYPSPRPPTVRYRPQLFFGRRVVREETGAELWEPA